MKNAENSLQKTKLVKEIRDFVQTNTDKKITPTILAEVLGKDVSYLSRHFKKETGMTISNFINRVKIDEALLMVSTTDKSISHIADELGFSSTSYFAKVFRQVEGISPIEYKNNQVKI